MRGRREVQGFDESYGKELRRDLVTKVAMLSKEQGKKDEEGERKGERKGEKSIRELVARR